MKSVIFLFRHPKLTKRDAFNLLFTSPESKIEEICGNHEKPELTTKTTLTTKIESAATGKDVLDHWRFPRIG